MNLKLNNFKNKYKEKKKTQTPLDKLFIIFPDLGE
jgi:hypothetical protein